MTTQQRTQRPCPSSSGNEGLGVEIAGQHTAMYMMILDVPSITHNELVRRGFDSDYVKSTMPMFMRRGLVRQLAEGVWEAIPPNIALPAFAARLEEYASTIRSSTPALTLTYSRREGPKPDPSGYERLNSLDEIALATQRLLSSAGRNVHGLRNGSPYTRYLLGLPTDFHATALRNDQGEQVVGRVTLDTELLNDPGINEVLAARASTGEEHRFAASLPFSALVSERMAVIDIDGPDGVAMGLVIESSYAAAAVRRVAESAWRAASPWQVGSNRPPTVDARDHRILQLLGAGATDSTIARQLNISQRTVERRVRAVMDRLGADTRFQAGVLAGKAGLI
ncbi:helix-turn-helix transcriptional regulator [Yimella sp. cx-573]|nr:helix-turn-helix transcriptional regulator [Yimella sp. cx-573]